MQQIRFYSSSYSKTVSHTAQLKITVEDFILEKHDTINSYSSKKWMKTVCNSFPSILHSFDAYVRNQWKKTLETMKGSQDSTFGNGSWRGI